MPETWGRLSSRSITGSIVQALVPAVLDPGHQLPLRRRIARQLVRDHDPRRPALLLQQLAQQPLGRFLVAPALDQHVEHGAVLVDGAPQPVLRAGNPDLDLVQVPLVTGRRGSRRRISFANAWPNLRPHWRTVSWLTVMPRAASSSSTIRRPSGKRK